MRWLDNANHKFLLIVMVSNLDYLEEVLFSMSRNLQFSSDVNIIFEAFRFEIWEETLPTSIGGR